MFRGNTILKQHCFILTGGPGAGKTTTLEELKRRGFICLDEVARDIIREQVEAGGNAVPWSDVLLYRQIMFDRTLEQYLNKIPSDSNICFVDRGIPDIVSYSKLIDAPVDKMLDEASNHYRYNQKVLIFPPWEEIYTTDKERKQSFEEAIRTYQFLKEVYAAYKYETIDVAPGSVSERADFIIATAQANFK